VELHGPDTVRHPRKVPHLRRGSSPGGKRGDRTPTIVFLEVKGGGRKIMALGPREKGVPCAGGFDREKKIGKRGDRTQKLSPSMLEGEPQERKGVGGGWSLTKGGRADETSEKGKGNRALQRDRKRY